MDARHMLVDSWNFNLLPDSVQSRGGTDVILTLPERVPVTSLSPTIRSADNVVILSTTRTGNIYRDSTLLKNLQYPIDEATYLEWNNHVVINVGHTVPQVWDKIDTTTFDYPDTHLADDWKLDGQYPTVMVVYGKGESTRAWAVNVATRPKSLYYSAPLNIDELVPVPDFASGGKFVITTPNDEPLVAATDFGDKLFAFTNSQTYIINDESPLVELWSYIAAPWRGGTISQRTLVSVENDLLSMMHDRTIYSITAVMSYGDYKIASITEPAAISNYIRENTRLAETQYIHMMFDPNVRAVKTFLSSEFSRYNDMALAYFIDKGIQNGWSIHSNIQFQSGYDARSSILYKFPDRDVALTGDYFGRIWVLEQDLILDDGEFFPMQITTPWLSAGDFRSTKRFQNGWLEIANHCPLIVNIAFLKEGSTSAKEIEKSVAFTEEALFDVALWDEAVFGGKFAKQHLRYPIHQITQSLQQVFTFLPVDAFNTARWDEADFDAEDALFAYEDEDYAQFQILSNVLDIKPVASRLEI
jgi:hypothetical protein